MPRLNKKQLKDITVFRERQEEILPLSLNEMYLVCRPITNWVWWVFPSNKLNSNHPEPQIILDDESILRFIFTHPPEWRLILRRIVKTIHFRQIPLVRIFPENTHLYLQDSIKLLLKTLTNIDDINFIWLYDYLQTYLLFL